MFVKKTHLEIFQKLLVRQAVKAGIVLALRRLPIDKMRWGASVLQILLVTDKINRDIISNEYGDDILEQMLIFMMRSNVDYTEEEI